MTFLFFFVENFQEKIFQQNIHLFCIADGKSRMMVGIYWSKVRVQQITPLYKNLNQWHQYHVSFENILHMLDHLFHFDIQQERKERITLEIVAGNFDSTVLHLLHYLLWESPASFFETPSNQGKNNRFRIVVVGVGFI